MWLDVKGLPMDLHLDRFSTAQHHPQGQIFGKFHGLTGLQGAFETKPGGALHLHPSAVAG
jgi:hypothetical protein